MNVARTTSRALLLFAAAVTAAAAQDAPTPAAKPAAAAPVHHTKPKAPASPESAYNDNLIVLDPAHGGADSGAKLGENSFEKDATLAFAQRLRTLLAAQGFTVVMTRENSTDEVTLDQRTEIANRSRPVACLLLHATPAGHGVHLYTSALTPPYADAAYPDDPKPIPRWDTAQAATIPQSVRLVNDLSQAINGARIPLITGQSSVRPIDSFACPAVALELAPQRRLDSDTPESDTPASDPGYQQRIAQAVAQALVFWRGHVVSSAMAAQAAKAISTPTPTASKPAPKPKPKPIVPPVEVPDDNDVPAPPKKAPIVRATPPAAAPPASAQP